MDVFYADPERTAKHRKHNSGPLLALRSSERNSRMQKPLQPALQNAGRTQTKTRKPLQRGLRNAEPMYQNAGSERNLSGFETQNAFRTHFQNADWKLAELSIQKREMKSIFQVAKNVILDHKPSNFRNFRTQLQNAGTAAEGSLKRNPRHSKRTLKTHSGYLS